MCPHIPFDRVFKKVFISCSSAQLKLKVKLTERTKAEVVPPEILIAIFLNFRRKMECLSFLRMRNFAKFRLALKSVRTIFREVLSIERLIPRINFAGTHLYTLVERGTVRVSVLPKNGTRCPKNGLEAGPLYLEARGNIIIIIQRR